MDNRRLHNDPLANGLTVRSTNSPRPTATREVPGPAGATPIQSDGSAAALRAEITELYGAYALSITRYAARHSANADLARETVQESFLRYMQARQEGQAISNPRAWLFRVARNYFLDQLRHDSHMVDEPLLNPVAGRETDPDSLLALSGLESSIRETLSSRELECSMLRAKGCSYEEIAGAMRLKPGTVGAMLSRAAKKLSNLNPRFAKRAASAVPTPHHSE